MYFPAEISLYRDFPLLNDRNDFDLERKNISEKVTKFIRNFKMDLFNTLFFIPFMERKGLMENKTVKLRVEGSERIVEVQEIVPAKDFPNLSESQKAEFIKYLRENPLERSEVLKRLQSCLKILNYLSPIYDPQDLRSCGIKLKIGRRINCGAVA